MVKLVFVFLSIFWMSCGNAPQTSQNKTASTDENMERIQTTPSDAVLFDESEKENVSVSEDVAIENVSENQEILQQEEPSRPLEIAQENEKIEKKVVTLRDHSQWNSLLSKYVNEKGDVDYKSFKNDKSSLDTYLNHLAENSPKKNWPKNEKLAYYINLYNAATVKLILDNYPTNSIKDIKNPWGKSWVKTGDGLLSLGDIEHKILRKMDEPRIHFAINCASFSCPKLLNKAFTAPQMEAQLHDATIDFINDQTRNILSKEKIQLSNIFKWYKKDFTKNGSLTDYIKPYTEIEINSDTDIDYLKYDWNLNEIE